LWMRRGEERIKKLSAAQMKEGDRVYVKRNLSTTNSSLTLDCVCLAVQEFKTTVGGRRSNREGR